MTAESAEERFTDNRGELVVQRPAAGVLVFVESGYLAAARAENIARALDDELRAHRRLTIFVDGERLQGYDPPIRTVPTDWLKKHSDVVVCQHMLVRSQIAKMGLAVAGLALGAVIKGYTERRAFQLALDEAIRLAKGSPGASVSA